MYDVIPRLSQTIMRIILIVRINFVYYIISHYDKQHKINKNPYFMPFSHKTRVKFNTYANISEKSNVAK